MPAKIPKLERPKGTTNWTFRVGTPPKLIGVHGLKKTHRLNTNESSHARAVRAQPAVLAAHFNRWVLAEAAVNKGPPEPRAIQMLARKGYERRLVSLAKEVGLDGFSGQFAESDAPIDPSAPSLRLTEEPDESAAYITRVVTALEGSLAGLPTDGDGDALVATLGTLADTARELLREFDLLDAPPVVSTLAEELLRAEYSAHQRLLSFARGHRPLYDFAADRPALDASFLAPSQGGQLSLPSTRLTIGDLTEAWIAKREPGADTAESYPKLAAQFAEFVGHKPADQVNRRDAAQWAKSLRQQGYKVSGIKRRQFAALSAIYGVAVADADTPDIEANPFLGHDLGKAKTQSPAPYSDCQARALLEAARDAKQPFHRWATWLMAYTGLRVGETAQLCPEDFRTTDGVHYLALDPDKHQIKTSRPRLVPLHEHLIAEGLLEFVESCQKGQPLFADYVKPDKNKSRNTNASKRMAGWASKHVPEHPEGKRTVPSHSWRHRLTDLLRENPDCHADARMAMLGHEEKGTKGRYGTGHSMKALYDQALRGIPRQCP